MSKIFLENGDYDAKGLPQNATVNLEGDALFGVRIHLHSDWRIGGMSWLKNVSILPHEGSLILDNAAWSILERVSIHSPLPAMDTGGIRDWRKVQVSGVGIRVTASSTDANAWGVLFNRCRFAKLETGIFIDSNRDKRTNGWILRDCVFEDTRNPIVANRIGGWHIDGGMSQLARIALQLDGNNNRVLNWHTERSELDILIAGGDYNFINADSRVVTHC